MLALAFSLASRSSAAGALKSYATVTLKDGRELSSVEVINYTTTDVLVRYDGGATSLHTDLLPDNVLADLHLHAPVASASLPPLPAMDDPAFLALADKVAVSTSAPAPASGAPGFKQVNIAAVTVADSNVSAAQLAAASAPAPANSAPVTMGEGNLGFTVKSVSSAAPIGAAHDSMVSLAGRIAVTPTGVTPHYLRDVEVRAYPAELLAKYLVQARAQAAELGQQLRDQSAALVQAGRLAEGEALAARAVKVAANYLDFIPVAPYTARSDEIGQFTLRHDLRDVRLVAVGSVTALGGDWNYAWVDIAPAQEAFLTDANATIVTSPGLGRARYAAR